MATKMYLKVFGRGCTDAVVNAPCCAGYYNQPDYSGSSGEDALWASTTAPDGTAGNFVFTAVGTVAGPVTAGRTTMLKIAPYLTAPVSASVTISGSITFNLWGFESNMSANAGFEVAIAKIAPDGTLTSIIDSEFGTELAVTTAAVNNWSATPGAGVTLNVGDVLAIYVGFNDGGGTMASGFTVQGRTGGTAGGTDDSWVQFTENISFESFPAGSTYYLRSAIDSGVSVASEDSRQMNTTDPGTGSPQTIITNTAAGPTAPIRCTSSAGGNVTAWYTPALGTQTITGPIRFDLADLFTSVDISTNVGVYVTVGTCNGDGSGFSQIGGSRIAFGTSGRYELEIIGTGAGSRMGSAYIPIANTNLTNGQRLCFRVYIDDATCWGVVVNMATGRTATCRCESSNAFVTFQETLTLPSVPGPVLVARGRVQRAQAMHARGRF